MKGITTTQKTQQNPNLPKRRTSKDGKKATDKFLNFLR